MGGVLELCSILRQDRLKGGILVRSQMLEISATAGRSSLGFSSLRSC